MHQVLRANHTITVPGYSCAKALPNPPSRIHHVVGKKAMSIAQETLGDHGIPQGRGEGTYKKQPHLCHGQKSLYWGWSSHLLIGILITGI